MPTDVSETTSSLSAIYWIDGRTSTPTGENVSAAEVEGFLLRHPAVDIAQVVAAPDDYYVEVPAAYIELKPGATATEPEIIDFCLGNIATYRVPRYVRFVEEWPMSGTKIKKYVLRERIRKELLAVGHLSFAAGVHYCLGTGLRLVAVATGDDLPVGCLQVEPGIHRVETYASPNLFTGSAEMVLTRSG